MTVKRGNLEPMSYADYTENDTQNITQWIKDKNISMDCTICNNGEFELRQGVITPQYMDFDSGVLSDDGFPMISFECTNCGNLRFFSLYRILPYKLD